MKNVYLLFALQALFSATPGFSQTSQPEFYNHVEAIKAGPDGAVHLIIAGSSAGSSDILAQRIQPGGQSKTILLLYEGIPLGYDVMPVSDGYIAAAAFFQCDIPVPWELYKYDWDGNLIWKQPLNFSDDPFEPMKLLPGPANMVWIFRENKEPLLYSAGGELFETGPFALSLFDGFRTTPDNRSLTFGKKGLALYHPNLLSYQFALKDRELLGAEALPDGHFVALSADTLYLLDKDFVLEKAVAHHISPGSSYLGLTLAGGDIRIIAHTAPRQILTFDVSTLLLKETLDVPPTAPFQPQELLGQNDLLFMAGEELPLNGTANQVVSIRSYPVPGVPDFSATADAAVEDVVLPSAPTGKQDYSPPFPLAYSMQLKDAYVLVKNEGPAVLQELTLNCVLATFNWFCGPEEAQFRKTYQNLNLLPGETKQLPVGTLEWSAPGVLPLTVSFCFRSSLPNDSLDADHTNNMRCRSASVTVPTLNPQSQVQTLLISPNPSSGSGTVRWTNGDFEPATVRVFDPTGRLQLEEQVMGPVWTFERQRLPAGMYLVTVRNAGGQLFSGRLAVD